MIINRTTAEVEEKLSRESERNPIVAKLSAVADSSSDRFEVETECSGFELKALTPLANGLPNRARMKVFSPKAGHTLVFFYKRSLVPYNRDRYSYGGIDLRTSQIDEIEVAEWLSFLSSGFHPDQRPPKLRRAFPYEIPE